MISKVVAVSALAAAGVQAASTEANPIRRVVTLMQDMQKELEAEGAKEDDLFKKFSCYCSGNTENLTKAGEEAAAQIEELTAKVKAEKAEKKQVAEELKQHKKDRSTAKQDLEKATAIRKKEHETYLATAGDTQANIEATKGAVKALESGMGGAAFIQTPFASQLKALVSTVESVDANDRETLMAFLQANGDYVPASGQIVGILKNMLDEMDKGLNGMVSDEDSAAAAFKDLKAAKQKEIALATQAIESKTERVGELAVSIVQNEGAAKDATADLEDSQKFLANLAVTCKEKQSEYDERVKIRQDEVAAISEAISVLNDDDALDVFKSALPRANKGSFLQKGAKVSKIAKAKAMISKADFTKSPALNLLAHTIQHKLNSNSKVDFSSVMKMIDDMVALLKKEQADDESHKTYCEGELDTSADEKKDLKQKIASLDSAISEMRDEIAALGEKIAALTAENKALDTSVAEATEQRKQEHADYTAKVQLNEAAIQLIFKAKNRLQKFYNPDQHVAAPVAEPTEEELSHSFKVSFVQIKQHNQGPELESAPETWEGGYQSKGKKSNSVMALMDRLTKELETEVKEAEHDEKTATKEYQELMADAQENRAANTKSISDKNKSKADIEVKLEETKTQNIVTKDQLTTTEGYIADLHQSCDFILANFEVRREARTAEQESLVNAKAVLSGADFK